MVVSFETSRNTIPAPDERPGHDGQPAERKAPNGKTIEQGCRLSGEAQCADAPHAPVLLRVENGVRGTGFLIDKKMSQGPTPHQTTPVLSAPNQMRARSRRCMRFSLRPALAVAVAAGVARHDLWDG